jgi:hypothetical protein
MWACFLLSAVAVVVALGVGEAYVNRRWPEPARQAFGGDPGSPV